MQRSAFVTVAIDGERLRANAWDVGARVAVPVLATVKADGYGLGAGEVADTIKEEVEGFCVFALREAVEVGLSERTGKAVIALGPPETLEATKWIDAGVRPAVSTVEQARALREARPILCVDTGMQRFACPSEKVAEVIEAGEIEEAYTHATRVEHVRLLREITRGHDLVLHAAATALIDEPAAWLDAVRPGLAIFRGAVRVGTRLAEVRRSEGPVGYTGWRSESGWHGVILAGYSNGLRAGPVVVNGRRQRVVEVGMQTAYVTLAEGDGVGDEVVLLGEGLGEADVGFGWGVTPHEVVLRMASMGEKAWMRE
jgi:alanine racemase